MAVKDRKVLFTMMIETLRKFLSQIKALAQSASVRVEKVRDNDGPDAGFWIRVVDEESPKPVRMFR